MAGQLHLFKGKRQRGVKLPPAPEFNLNCMVGDILERWCTRSWRYTHFPAGEERPKTIIRGKPVPLAGLRLKRMGLTPGWPDFQFFHCAGPVAFLELKRQGEEASDEQKALAFHLMRAGHGYALADNFRDALEVLRAWRIVPASVGV